MRSERPRLPPLTGLAGRFALVVAVGLLSACQSPGSIDSDYSARAYQPISSQMLALMAKKDTNERAPILLRAYKKEAVLEIWKMKDNGHYTLLKTYPMCRWSGQLGPKKREGDRQVPEGFYTITPGQMNPHSEYYLSFNVGYPNAYDRAHGYTGGDIMVHGVCSSAGCFSMTNKEIAEIYAIVREAFDGGQKEIQLESLPFRMTAENLAKYRLDPNIRFWKELKKGVDAFDVTKEEPKVGVCGKHYVFDETPVDAHVRLNPTAVCPPLKEDSAVAKAVAAKEARDNAAVATLVAEGVPPIRTVYADGGQNPVFASRKGLDVSRPAALARGPVNIVLGANGKPLRSAAVAAHTKRAERTLAGKTVAAAKVRATGSGRAMAYASMPRGGARQHVPFYEKWFGFLAGRANPAPAVRVFEPATPVPANVPLPPRRLAASATGRTGGARTSVPPRKKPKAPAAPLRLRRTIGSAGFFDTTMTTAER